MKLQNTFWIRRLWLPTCVIVLTLSLQSCSKNRDVLFDLPIELRFEIPAGLNPLDRHFLTIPNVNTNLSSFKDQFETGGQPMKIVPSNAVLSSLDGNINFGFLREVQVSIYVNNDPDQDHELFLTDNVPPNAGRNVVILPFDNDISDLLEPPQVDFVISWRLRATTPARIESVINLTLSAEQL